jgi:hypothetical protein
MSKADIYRTKKRITGRLDYKEDRQNRFRAVCGDGAGNVWLDRGNSPYIYIRRQGRGRIDKCLCLDVTVRNNLPVIVGYTHERPGELQVLTTDMAAMNTTGGYSYASHHHQQHELFNPKGGDDTVWVHSQQFLPMLLHPTDPVSMYFRIRPGHYLNGEDFAYFNGALSMSMASYEPDANEAIMLLVYI